MAKINKVPEPIEIRETIKEVAAVDQSFMDMQRYALYATRFRTTPDFRDGLIPVQRRIIFDAFKDAHLTDPRDKIKCAAIVGSVINLYHPHGDTSVYGALVGMANWFQINMPLIKPHGNFGNLQGASPAAYRYTECGLTQFAIDCVISDLALSNQSVDWRPNYADKIMEPEYLPVSVPLLLVNGSFNIGVGMRPDIPAHNLGEVIDVTIGLMHNPTMRFGLAPDHGMPCEIINTDWEKVNNGEITNYTVRSKIDIEVEEHGKYKGNYILVIRSIPDLTYLETIDKAIDELIVNGELIQVIDTEDRSKDDKCEYVVILKKGADPNFVRDIIWKRTRAQQTLRVNFETLVNGVPQWLSYREYLLAFIEFRKITKFRLYSNRLQDARTKIHEKDAFITILKSGAVDEVIDMMKKNKGKDDRNLIEWLIKRFHITDMQASFIINAKLKNISLLYLQQYIDERAKYETSANWLTDRLLDGKLIEKDIEEELLAIKAKYAAPRRCPIINVDLENAVPAGEFKIVITRNNFIRKLQPGDPIKTFKGDAPRCCLTVDNKESILIFDEMGKVFKLPIHKIPLADKTTNGTDIRFLIKNLTSNINTIIYEPDMTHFMSKNNPYYLLVVTKLGNIKKMELSDFENMPVSGILYTKLEPGDSVCSLLIMNDRVDIIVYSDKAALRMGMKQIPCLKRNTKGCKAMTTKYPIDGLSYIRPMATDIVVTTANGYINRFPISGLECKGRAKSGSPVIKLGKTDKIVNIFGLCPGESISIATVSGVTTVPLDTIPIQSSVSTGVRLYKDQILESWITQA